jgi:DNA (cytosine-5)-methyltransferase 1
MKIASFFAGAGGLDSGFEKAGFDVIWANEYDKSIWKTYEKNHKNTFLDKRNICDIPSNEIPDCDGIIGGPPCQSWSEAGSLGGIKDKRGQLFYEFMRVLADKKPKFFLAENVYGMLLPVHRIALNNILQMFKDIGYNLSFQLLNVADYGISQDRKRVFFVGFRKDLELEFIFPEATTPSLKQKKKLEETILDLKGNALSAKKGNLTNGEACKIANHEYMTGGFSSIYMSRNRVRSWNEVSFTIQAMGRHAPIHPQAPKMTFIEQNLREFKKGKEKLYRRLSIRECARIQTFPDDFIFYYDNLADGYKMIGNAVPIDMAKILAEKIHGHLSSCNTSYSKIISSNFANKEKKRMNGNFVKKRMENLIKTLN